MRSFTGVVTAFIAMVVAGSAFAGSDVTKLPGYVDFDTDAILGDTEATVEINLSEGMLKFVAGAANLADRNSPKRCAASSICASRSMSWIQPMPNVCI